MLDVFLLISTAATMSLLSLLVGVLDRRLPPAPADPALDPAGPTGAGER